MKYEILTLRDITANEHFAPMYVKNIGVAFRDFGDMLTDPSVKNQIPWAKHPDDIEIWHTGQWDSETAEYTLQKPVSLGILAQLLPNQQ